MKPGPGQYDIPGTIGRIPKYNHNLQKKIDDNGETKIIKYNPEKTREIRFKVVDDPKGKREDRKEDLR